MPRSMREGCDARSMPEAIARRWVPGEGPVDIRPTATGLVNESYRVSRSGLEYSLRLAAAHSSDLGLDRSWECRVLRAASAAQLAPPVFECDPVRGVIVAGWLDGRAWTHEEALRPAALDAIASLLRRVHALPIPTPARVMSAADWIAHYSGGLARCGVLLREPALAAATEDHLAIVKSAGPVNAVVCHSDLHFQNLLVCPPAAPSGAAGTGGHVGEGGGAGAQARLVLLDWEYSHVSDPFWDVVGWAGNNDWPMTRTEALLSVYLQRTPSATELRRLSALAWLYDYVCLLWSQLYVNLRDGPDGPSVSRRAEQLNERLRSLR